MLCEYATLIDAALAYVKENASCIFATPEEWQALQMSKTVLRSVAKQTPSKTDPLNHFGKGSPPTPMKRSPAPTKEPFSREKVETKILPVPQQEKRVHPTMQNDPSKIKNFLHRFPIALNETIPDDASATQTLYAYKTYIGAVDVVLFASESDPETLSLIKSLSKNIDQKLGPVKILSTERWEKEGLWDSFLTKNPLKLIIATAGFSQLKKAMSHYVSPDGGKTSFIHHIPLIILAPCETYAKSPKEKVILWNQISAILKQ